MSDDSADRGFKVVDKRSFDREGQEREDAQKEAVAESEAEAPEAPAAPEEATTSPEAEPECAEPDEGTDDPMPEMDFVTFLLSLHNSAACLLGKAPYPDTGTCAVNLPMAKQTIDIIGMLQDKTKGNLTGEEERIVSEVLYDLRMAYVQAAKP